MEWQPIKDAPRDGTWILLRGRNAVDAPMIPVVARWRDGRWSDSASGRDMGHLVADIPRDSEGADWVECPL